MKLIFKLLITLVFFSQVSTTAALEKATKQRVKEIAKRGAHVMPFDLDQTMHVFSKNKEGGLQQVVVKKTSDLEQISLIRQHLSEIASDFKDRKFTDPTRLHGADMPGLATLKKAKPKELSIEYSELPDGGQIVYKTNKQALIHAIHQWFDAQMSDHSQHAMPHHPNHKMHKK